MLVVGFYIWICILFSLWYFYPKFKQSRDVEKGFEGILAIITGVFVVTWYWPLMIVYTVRDHRQAKKLELEEFKRKNG